MSSAVRGRAIGQYLVQGDLPNTYGSLVLKLILDWNRKHGVIHERRRTNGINEKINNKGAYELNFPNSACSHMLIILSLFCIDG
jgi:hypothetical protein